MASSCPSRRFFSVDEALPSILEGIESGDSDGALGASSGAGVKKDNLARSRLGPAVRRDDSDASGGSEDDADADWEDADDLGARAVRDFFDGTMTSSPNLTILVVLPMTLATRVIRIVNLSLRKPWP